ncbi:hypothetical protein [Candidatus Poriferisocius sp.]|uniref:hypothetical protein n=1 Tax=Candidatus Poriferisocius sp. TaxID=3101276 RepID=UPI003B020304
MRHLLAALLAIAVGCGNATETAHQAEPIPSPTPAHTIPATPPPAPTASSSPTATETAVYETASGLECYTKLSADVQYEHGMAVAEEDVEGFSTLGEAVSDWWENRPDRYRDPDDPLTRSPEEANTVAFRDERGNAQLLLHGEQFSKGVWAVGRAEFCSSSIGKIR